MTGRGTQPHDVETLSVTANTPDEKYRAMRCIAGAARDVEDARLLLDVVLNIPRPKIPQRQPKDRFHSRVYRYPVPVGAEGEAYRRKVRTWGRAQGHEVLSRAPLEGWLLNLYVETTGDVWSPEGANA